MIRYPTQRRIHPYHSLLDWLADETWLGSEGGRTADTVPAMDVRETDAGYVVEMTLPGIRPEDIEVTLDGRVLTIRGKTSSRDHEGEQGRYLLQERRAMSFARSITLPAETDAEAVASEFEDGELRLTLPISKGAGARRIAIGGGSNARQVTGQATDVQPEQQDTDARSNGQTGAAGEQAQTSREARSGQGPVASEFGEHRDSGTPTASRDR